jgi:hypothetical protein
MHVAALALLLAAQADAAQPSMADALGARLKLYKTFTVGALADGLGVVLQHGQEAESRKDFKAAAALYDAGAQTLASAVMALETRPPELRRAAGHLEKARKRAAAMEPDEKRVAALLYGLRRAELVYVLEVSAVTDLFNLAVRLLSEGHLAESEDALQEIDDRFPALANAVVTDTPQAIRWVPFIRSRIHLVRGQYREAADALRVGLTRAPEWADEERAIVKIHAREGEAERIAKALEDHLAKNADDLNALLLQAHDAFFGKDPRLAEPLFRAILKKDAENKEAKYFLERIPQD